MPFPKETLKWAEDIKQGLVSTIGTVRGIQSLEAILTGASAIRDMGASIREAFLVITHNPALTPKEKKLLASAVYFGLQYDYGFEDSLRTGNWMPWPHEINQVNCYSYSIANFAATQALGLDPKLGEFVGIGKPGSSDIAGHSLVIVNVGTEQEPEYWTIDRSHRMYGPIDLNDKYLEVHNRDPSGVKTKKYNFVSMIESREEEIVAQVDSLRNNPEAVLYSGQRIGILELDGWQSDKPILTSWFLKFEQAESKDERGDIISRIILPRPGIKSRGLEYRITLDADNRVKRERLLGYYCRGMIWADFVEEIPLVDIEFAEAIPLLVGVAEIPLERRSAFERELMQQSSSPSGKYKPHIEAARRGYMKFRESEDRDIVSTLAAVEALYQHEKGDRPNYLTEREKEVDRIRRIDPAFSDYSKFLNEIRLRRKTKGKKRTLGFTNQAFSLINAELREDPRTTEFLAIRTEAEMLTHLVSHGPLFFYDAVDRLIFYDRKIKGGMEGIHKIARTTFGSGYEQALFSGYTKIFAEFLGHFAVTLRELSLQAYRSDILRKLT